ncbi:MAG: restriction endonuclease subunit S [Candidatus Dojkabacteria bacterium]|nr:restriction endonuclease subunit S [Candidatus Dojkabacteria bacterium]
MQTFVVDRKNICSRFDAYYYQPKYKMLEQRIKSKYSVSSFQDLTVGVTNGLDYRAFVDEGIPYIRVGDIGKGEVHFRKVKRVPKKLLNEKKSAVPKKGNLLLTRKGSYGNAAVYETTDEAIVSSEVFCVRLGERIIPEYMAIFINSELGRLQFERNAVGAIMGSISQNALSSVFVPVPPQDVQEKIVTIMKEAYEKKRKLE